MGDVNIDESVTNIAGNFIVLGDDTPCPAPGCGWVNTGAIGGGSADQPLDVYGIIVKSGQKMGVFNRAVSNFRKSLCIPAQLLPNGKDLPGMLLHIIRHDHDLF